MVLEQRPTFQLVDGNRAPRACRNGKIGNRAQKRRTVAPTGPSTQKAGKTAESISPALIKHTNYFNLYY
jgi:hypothetical protein